MQDLLKKIFRSEAGILLGLALCTLAAYACMLASPFKTLDDDFSILKNPEIRRLIHIPDFFRSTYFKADQDYYRPLVYVTYTLEYRFYRLNYFFYNLDNVLLHVLNSWLVFWLAGLLFAGPPGAGGGAPTVRTGGPVPGGRETSARAPAAAVALLFAIHPIHWEAVGNVSGRAILLCAFFVLGGMICFLRYCREGRPRSLWAAVIAFALGLTAKESAGVLLLTLAAYAGLVERPRVQSPSKLAPWLWLLPFGVLAAGYLVLRHTLGIAKMFPWPSQTTMVLGLASFLKGILIYLKLFLWPLDLRFDRGLPIFGTFRDPAFWLTLAAWSAILASLWRFRRALAGLPGFCLAWFLIELFPVSQIVTTIGVYPGAISLAEHFVYVASVPVFVLLVYAAGRLQAWAAGRKVVSVRVMQGAYAGMLLFFFILLVQQNIYASNEFVMLRDSLAKDPRNARLQYSLGMVYAKAQNPEMAVEHFRKAVELHGCNYRYHLALGKALTDRGDLLGAAREYESIPPNRRINPLLESNKTAVYRLLAADYERKVAAAPADPALHFALGVFHAKLGDQARALEQYRRTVELKPDHFDAWYNIAVTSEALGDRAGARAAYGQLVQSGAGPRNPHFDQARAALERLGGQ